MEQWLGVRLPMWGTRVPSLVWGDPTCRGAAELVPHGYWACALEPASCNCWGPRVWSQYSAEGEAVAVRGPGTAMKTRPPPNPAHRGWRGPARSHEDPTQPKINKLNK